MNSPVPVLTPTPRKILCPHLGEVITKEACNTFRNRPMPTSSPQPLRHWCACQECLQPCLPKETR